jgi:hypothetical protein
MRPYPLEEEGQGEGSKPLVLRPLDDLRLQFLRQIAEKVVVAGYANDEVAARP